MGPSMFVDGDAGDLAVDLSLLGASMGPSMFVDGDIGHPDLERELSM